MPTRQTSKPSRKERTGVDRLYKYVGARKVSFYYQYADGTSETLASAPLGDRQAIMEAERTAKRKAMDIQQGVIIAGSVADMIERFKKDVAPTHYRDQSKDGLAVRESGYKNLIAFFGKMAPQSLKTIHGYQYLKARADSGAPIKANKELALMSTICRYAIQWGVIEANPFKDMMLNQADKDVRTITRSQIVKFYLWSQKQASDQFRTLGCAALFTYLTGFRAAEVRPFHTSGLTKEGVRVIGAKRKKGEAEIVKLREWSPRLQMVVKRAKQARGKDIGYLFANRHGQPYTRSGWGSVWQDAMIAWIGCEPKALVEHPQYFSLLDVRPAAITTKITKRSADMYDFAAHANPSTTHKHYDRRKVKRASATE
jgi:integrase